MENLYNQKRNEHIAELTKSIMKYDTYLYRSITGGEHRQLSSVFISDSPISHDIYKQNRREEKSE